MESYDTVTQPLSLKNGTNHSAATLILSIGGHMDFPKCRACAKPFRMVPLGYTWTWEPSCFCNQPVNLTTIVSTTTEGTKFAAE